MCVQNQAGGMLREGMLMYSGSRYLGIDFGAERIKVAEVFKGKDGIMPGRTWLVEHHKNLKSAVEQILEETDLAHASGVACTGRLAPVLALPSVPPKAVVAEGVALLHPDLTSVTVVGIGSNGFWVVDVEKDGICRMKENSRCSQGTGNFLAQLVERFNCTLEEADRLCENVAEPAPLSGRCPVILKTDMTHLANRGEPRDRILAGLYDAVCDNVQNLIAANDRTEHLLLVGGVCKAPRIRSYFANLAPRKGLKFVDSLSPGQDDYLEAYGAASIAARKSFIMPSLAGGILAGQEDMVFERLPGLDKALSLVTRMKNTSTPALGKSRGNAGVALGFDMGSTGSKAVALDVDSGQVVWEAYLNTLGNPVGAAKELVGRFLDEMGGGGVGGIGKFDIRNRLHQPVPVRVIGVTGSGREIVGTLMESLFSSSRVFVCNEIAAHAKGAVHFDPLVDTIFEIGGQDAKYIRLDHGKIFDAAMNEACSAGTGSFIEEQGKKFDGIKSVVELGQLALKSSFGVSLGQHCSVFMAEIIDQAVSANVPSEAIVAGIYDSVVQNYLNRVKGTRSVGDRIFCQGMPFASDALAAAVANRTGRPVVIPPNPGTIGALGIALLAIDELVLGGVAVDSQPEAISSSTAPVEPIDLKVFLSTEVVSRDTFVCKSTKGCGGSGNNCRIQRLTTSVSGMQNRFLWGGSCSLYDGGVKKGRKVLPPDAPDPFREREELVSTILAECSNPGRPVVSTTDEFALKESIPFFATFISALGFDVNVHRNAGRDVLKRGIEEAVVPYCAPMQLYHGLISVMLEQEPEYLLLPMLREMPRHEETSSVTCPMVQGSPGLLRDRYGDRHSSVKLLNPVINMGAENFRSQTFRESCRELAASLGREDQWETAWSKALQVQETFDSTLHQIGRRSLEYAIANGVAPVVVLGRSYTIYNDVLNSHVPALLREQGALAIPVDTWPMEDMDQAPTFKKLYWHHGQKNLRTAHQLRRTEGVYSIFCSNYSCGPDSFNLGFYSYIMENKPFAVIETDGHSGDAGTRTRIEAFLYCVQTDRKLPTEERATREINDFSQIDSSGRDINQVRVHDDTVLIPLMGVGSPVAAAALRGAGIKAEALPLPTRDSLVLGRRYTSGKECVPMTITLGSLLQRLEQETDTEQTFTFLMPTASGPCRFGVYNLLHKIVVEKTGWGDRVKFFSPASSNYLDGLPADFQVKIWMGFVAADLMFQGLLHTRPVEAEAGAAQKVYDRHYGRLQDLMETVPQVSMAVALREIPRGMFGIRGIVRDAARDFASLLVVPADKGNGNGKRDVTANYTYPAESKSDLPVVAVVGEIYARLDPFANDSVIRRLEKAGARVHLAPFTEWLDYTSWLRKRRVLDGQALESESTTTVKFSIAVQEEIENSLYDEMAGLLGWGKRSSVEESIRAGSMYVNPRLNGEAILTVGASLHEYLSGAIDGVVSVGPLECMPNKIAEAHFNKIDYDWGMPSLTISLNGDPLDPGVIENFMFEVRERKSARKSTGKVNHPAYSQKNAAGGLSRGLLNLALRLIPPLPVPPSASMVASRSASSRDRTKTPADTTTS